MPRSTRLFTESGCYHIVTRGNNRQVLFRTPEDFRVYLQRLKLLKALYRFDLYHYCLMSNHLHLLARFYDREGLQKVMQRVNLSYARRYRIQYQYCGHVFQDRFRSFPVQDNTYLLECGRYIERNPLKAGLINDLADYRWSSYRYYAHGKPDELICPDPLYFELATDVAKRQAFYRDYVCAIRPQEQLTEKRFLAW